MNSIKFCHLRLACLLFACGIVGCQTGENGSFGNMKTWGVYTTLAISDPGLELPAAGYMQKVSFGAAETPAAVVVGCGYYNQNQLITLQLVELSTGRSLFSKDHYASYGKAMVQPLSIRLSGDYKVRLLVDGTERDSFRFTVARTNNSGAMVAAQTNSGANYAQGIFSLAPDPASLSSLFEKYDDKLLYTILNSVDKEVESTNRNLFAQRFAGKVVIQCRLDFKGRVSEPKILENTLDDECAAVFQKALLTASPYTAWPGDVHQKLGSDYRGLMLTFHYD